MRRRLLEGISVALGASALGAGLWTALNMAAMATVLPLHLDVSWIRLGGWGLAVLGAVAAAAAVTAPPSRATRAVLGALGAACLGGLAWSIAWSFEPDAAAVAFWAIAAIGGLAAAALAIRPWRAASIEGRGRAAALGLVAVAGLAWGGGVIEDFAEEHADQALPRRDLELRAAYPYSLEAAPGAMPAIVVDGAGRVGDVLELDGERFNVHASDALPLSPDDVARVRWIDAGEVVAVSIRIEGDARVLLDERGRARASQYDVLYADGAPVASVFHFGMEPGRLVLMGTERGALHAVYRRLTR